MHPPETSGPSATTPRTRPVRAPFVLPKGFLRAPQIPVAFAFWRALELRRLGRTLLYAGLIGIAAGIAASIFYVATDWVTENVLENFAGIANPKTAGQLLLTTRVFTYRRWWLIVLIPTLGGLVCGALTQWLAPEIAGGGGNAYLEAFHRGRGFVRRRVALLKVLASSITLGTGGSAGREGPTMQIGAAVGSMVGRLLRVDDRERRILLVAGAAGGMGAIFRTPLGGAIFAVEVLYRDDIEADAIVPAVISSVTAYSILITLLGRGTEFALPSHNGGSSIVPPRALPLYIVLGVVLALGGIAFSRTIHASQKLFAERVELPPWIKPGLGGLAVGLMALEFPHVAGIGYGWLEAAVNEWGWADPTHMGGEGTAVALLFAISILKIVASGFTIGSGGAGGDFGPSVFIGGLLGCAVGRFFHAVMPVYAPPAWTFGLVGMGALFGGIAHVPIASLIMVCEMAGSYDLVVPLMLAEGTTFVLCRRDALYRGQLRTRSDSPAHRDELTIDVLEDMKIREVIGDLGRLRAEVLVSGGTPLRALVERLTGGALTHLVVVDQAGEPRGVIDLDSIREILFDSEIADVAVAADVMRSVEPVPLDTDMHHALGHMIEAGVSAVPVIEREGGRFVGLVTQDQIGRAYHGEVVRRHVDSDPLSKASLG